MSALQADLYRRGVAFSVSTHHDPPARPTMTLEEAQHDPRALADRGLIQVNWRGTNARGQSRPCIRLTTAGRKLARAWTGAKACKAPPPGMLGEWHWRALAKAYAAGDEGLAGEYGEYAHVGWPTWRRLPDYKAGALVEEHGLRPPCDHRLRITAAGRRPYEHEWARYRELHPEVIEALEPSELEPRRMAERQHRRGTAPVRLVLTRRALQDPMHGQCGVCFERHRLEHLVVLGADELAICRGCYEAAAHFGRLSGGHPILFDLEHLS